jgi:hypothetical protein
MDHIKNKINTLNKIYQHVKLYYEKLYPVLLEKYKNEISYLEEKINKENIFHNIEGIIRKIENEDLINSNPENIIIHLNKLLNKNEIYNDIFTLYENISFYNKNLKFLIEIFDTPKFDTEYMSDISMSQTYKIEINDDFDIIKNIYRKYLEQNKNNDKKIDIFLSKIILIIFKVKNNIIFSEYENIENKSDIYFKLDNNLNNSIIEIRNYFIYNTDNVNLYVAILSMIMSELNKNIKLNKNFDIKYSCKKNINKIYEYIEQDKLFIFENNFYNSNERKLEINEINLEDNKNDETNNKQLGNRLKENKINKNKINKNKINKNNNPFMNSFSFIPNSNFYPLNKLVKLIFKLDKIAEKINLENFSKLHNCCFIVINKITPNPIEYNINNLTNKKLIEPITYGITNKFLEKTKTINPLINNSWNFSYEIYPNSILNENEDQLSLLKFYVIETLDGQTYRCMTKFINENIYNTNYNSIISLLNHIKTINNNLIYPTLKNYYQNIHIQKSISNMFLRKKLPLEPMEQESKIDSGLIRNILFINLCKIFDEFNSKIQNSDDINNIIHSDEINNEFIRSIIDLYKTYIKKETDTFPFSEIFITYLSELKKIASMFIRELHDNYNRDPLTNFTNKNMIREKFENILKLSLEYIITDKSNIYQIISYKNLLLNY